MHKEGETGRTEHPSMTSDVASSSQAAILAQLQRATGSLGTPNLSRQGQFSQAITQTSLLLLWAVLVDTGCQRIPL